MVFNLLLRHIAASCGENSKHIVRVVHAGLELFKLSALELNLGTRSRVKCASDRCCNWYALGLYIICCWLCDLLRGLWFSTGFNLGPNSCDLTFSGSHFLLILSHSLSVCSCVGRADALLGHCLYSG